MIKQASTLSAYQWLRQKSPPHSVSGFPFCPSDKGRTQPRRALQPPQRNLSWSHFLPWGTFAAFSSLKPQGGQGAVVRVLGGHTVLWPIQDPPPASQGWDRHKRGSCLQEGSSELVLPGRRRSRESTRSVMHSLAFMPGGREQSH